MRPKTESRNSGDHELWNHEMLGSPVLHIYLFTLSICINNYIFLTCLEFPGQQLLSNGFVVHTLYLFTLIICINIFFIVRYLLSYFWYNDSSCLTKFPIETYKKEWVILNRCRNGMHTLDGSGWVWASFKMFRSSLKVDATMAGSAEVKSVRMVKSVGERP